MSSANVRGQQSQQKATTFHSSYKKDTPEAMARRNLLRLRSHRRLGLTQTEWAALPADVRASEIAKQREIDAGRRTGYYAKDNPETKKRANDRRVSGKGMRTFRPLEGDVRQELPADIKKLRALKRSAPSMKRSKLLRKAGWVYVISNPAFPGWFKVGRTDDYVKRLVQLQTGDPRRAYRVDYLLYFNDVVAAEARAHAELLWSKHEGVNNEWFRTELGIIIGTVDAIGRELPGRLRPSKGAD